MLVMLLCYFIAQKNKINLSYNLILIKMIFTILNKLFVIFSKLFINLRIYVIIQIIQINYFFKF